MIAVCHVSSLLLLGPQTEARAYVDLADSGLERNYWTNGCSHFGLAFRLTRRVSELKERKQDPSAILPRIRRGLEAFTRLLQRVVSPLQRSGDAEITPPIETRGSLFRRGRHPLVGPENAIPN